MELLSSEQKDLALDILYDIQSALPTYPSIPWKQVKGMRDIISHHYFDVDPAQVLWIITNEIAPLKTAINSFITKLE